ncbi:MAG: hypothetical protein ACKV19_28265 [Verrucomicrobiales bacterium]
MMKQFRVSVVLVTGLALGAVGAARARSGKGVDQPVAAGAGERADAERVNLWTGEGVNWGGVLFPHFHFQAVYGSSSSDLGHELGAGHHDPVADGWTIQGFEVGLSARVGESFEAFATYHGYWENEDPNDYGDEFEEWFGKVKNLPGGFEVRGGRYLNRFGLHNATHLHAWNWMDNYLVNGRFLGDDGQYSIGGELTWNLPTPWTSVVSVSVGRPPREEHDEEGHDDHDEALFESEGAYFDDVLTVANWTNAWNLNDFHQFRGGLSGAWGNNVGSETTQVYGAHFQYEWRRNGLEPGGAYFRWRTEVMIRDFDAVSEGDHGHGDEHEGAPDPHGEHEDEHESEAESRQSLDDWGWYTSLSYGHPVGAGILEAALRFDWVADLDEAGLPGRRRISPGLTWYANELRTVYLRGQYNHDRIDGHGEEDSVWIGFGFNWGRAEVR